MKDQVTVLMEALRLVGVEVERFKKHWQSHDETLGAIERILDDPKVTSAILTIEPLVSSPALVPHGLEQHEHA